MTKNGNKPASPEDFQAAEKKVRALAEPSRSSPTSRSPVW